MRYNNRMSKIGYIYKLTPHNCEEFYIGSTTDMKNRESRHNTDSKIKTSKVYIKIRECGGFVMKLLYDYEFETDHELRMEEQRCMDVLKPTLNSQRAFTSEEDYIENKKQYCETNRDWILEQKQQYYESNKDAILEQHKIYNEKNRDILSEKKKIYYETNKDGISEQRKVYYEKNRDVISEKNQIYYETNKDALLEKKKIYKKKNKDAINAKKREQYKLKKQQQQQA